MPHSSAYTAHTPFDTQRIGAAAVYCSDGRYGEQMDEFLHHSLQLPRYDRIAIPGGCGCLGGHFSAYRQQEALQLQLKLLVEAHKLNRIVLIAHQDCGFYRERLALVGPQAMQQQIKDLHTAATVIRRMSANLLIDAYVALLHDDRVAFAPIAL